MSSRGSLRLLAHLGVAPALFAAAHVGAFVGASSSAPWPARVVGWVVWVVCFALSLRTLASWWLVLAGRKLGPVRGLPGARLVWWPSLFDASFHFRADGDALVARAGREVALGSSIEIVVRCRPFAWSWLVGARMKGAPAGDWAAQRGAGRSLEWDAPGLAARSDVERRDEVASAGDPRRAFDAFAGLGAAGSERR